MKRQRPIFPTVDHKTGIVSAPGSASNPGEAKQVMAEIARDAKLGKMIEPREPRPPK